MARRLLLLATLAAAATALVACDNPSSGLLSKAQPGQCFAVTGKDSLGQPKLIKAECGAPGAAPTAAAATQACMKPAAPVAAAPPSCGQTGVAHAHAASSSSGLTYSRAKYRPVRHVRARVVRKAVHHKGIVHYEYVPASGEVFHSSTQYDYARPPQTELAGGYTSHREEVYVAPPPPPPPPAYAHDYAERRYDNRDFQSRSYASESSSSSSAYTSSSTVRRRKPCNCRRDGHAVGPAQYERDGYLTWPGKSRY